jgi:Golgi SNAP receptor complex protein 2
LQSNENQDTTVLLMDMLGAEGQALDRSGDRIEEYIHLSKTALEELYEQRSMLKVGPLLIYDERIFNVMDSKKKSTQRRLLDAANTLGLSGTVIRFIEQRTAMDRYILWGGIVFSIVFMIFFVYQFG